jgi:adenylate cyclase
VSEAASERPVAPGYRIHHEPCSHRVRVVFHGVTVADSRRALTQRETRLAPVYYLPREDVRMDLLTRTDYRTHCPFKGDASYWTLRVGDACAENAVWSYEDPLPEAEPVRGYVAFHRNRMDAWYEEEQEVHIDPVTDAHLHGNPLVDWLLRDAWEATSIRELVARLARQLRSAGVPLLRMNLFMRTLHPQVMGAVHVWRRDTDGVEVAELEHWRAGEARFLESPFVSIFAGRGGIRRRLTGPDARLDFPILRDLAEQGATDYVAMPLTFSDGRIHALTLASDAPAGFDVTSLGHLHELLPLVSRLVEVHALRHTARTLLDTYLGVHTGARVLDGLIRRGDGEVIPAVVWWSDLRGSTTLTERLPRQEYLWLLNRFFECTAGSVIERGGEVLKFIGDAVMGIFPLEGNPEAGRRALDAASEALRRIRSLDAERELSGADPVRAVIALHQGEVSYGNVGIPGRLDFTVTGPTVNEVARLEGLAKQLGRGLLASESFARLVPGSLVSLGRHPLRGIAGEREVFSLEPPGERAR